MRDFDRIRMMRRATAAAVVAAALVLGGCGREPQVTGFLEVPWGATRAQVVAKHGEPETESPGITPEERSMNYEPRHLLDEPAEPYFLVHAEHGMFQGSWLVRVVGFETRCELVYERMVDAVEARYPGLKAKKSRTHTGERPFCEAVLAGTAEAGAAWRDPANGARVLVSISRGRPFIDVIYTSAEGIELGKAASDRELKKNF